jgi:acetate kinase
MSQAVLVLNAGSSSLKFTVYQQHEDGLQPCYDGQIEGIGTAPRFVVRDAGGAVLEDDRWAPIPGRDGKNEALGRLSAWLDPRLDEDGLLGVGHRVVHGGTSYHAPVVITPEVLAALEQYIPLAPLHQPANLAGIRAAMEFLPGVPNVACFDTAFHYGRPAVAEHFALPLDFHAKGLRRYGFHGLSYEYIARMLPTVAPELATRRVVVAHLGNGASMCALHSGRSVETTMSFTGLDGLPMGTRCGAIDPGVLLYLIQVAGLSGDELEQLLYQQAGLLGLSGISSDMRTLLASDDPRAAMAVAYFVYRVCQELGWLAASLGGIDGVVFTGGIGEHAASIRARICRDAAWLGIELDEAANAKGGPCISAAPSRVAVWVIPTDEELMIARHTVAALRQGVED